MISSAIEEPGNESEEIRLNPFEIAVINEKWDMLFRLVELAREKYSDDWRKVFNWNRELSQKIQETVQSKIAEAENPTKCLIM